MKDEVSIVLSTAPDEETAANIARGLLDAKAAACVNIALKIRSIYQWEGKVCDDAEVLLVIKTARDRVDEAIRTVKALHPYDVPEIIALDVSRGHADYLRWVVESVKP